MAFAAAAAPIIGLVGSAVSGVMGFFGAQQQASAQADAARYQAQVARNNQIIATQNAAYTAQAGASRAQAQDFKNRAILGGIEAAQGASGLDIEGDSSRRVRDSAARIGRLDTETLYNNALLQSSGQMAQGSNFASEAGLRDAEARNAQSAGLMRGFTSLLGGATSFADKWMSYQNKGVSGFGSIS